MFPQTSIHNKLQTTNPRDYKYQKLAPIVEKCMLGVITFDHAKDVFRTD